MRYYRLYILVIGEYTILPYNNTYSKLFIGYINSVQHNDNNSYSMYSLT